MLATQAMLRSRPTSYLVLVRLRLQGHHQLAGSLTFQGQVHGGNMEGQQSRATPPLQRAVRSAPGQLPYSSSNLTSRDFDSLLSAKLREKLRESGALGASRVTTLPQQSVTAAQFQTTASKMAKTQMIALDHRENR